MGKGGKLAPLILDNRKKEKNKIKGVKCWEESQGWKKKKCIQKKVKRGTRKFKRENKKKLDVCINLRKKKGRNKTRSEFSFYLLN